MNTGRPWRTRRAWWPSNALRSTGTRASTWCGAWRTARGGREIALYTGNDDNIVVDLLTPYRFPVDGKEVELRFVGGLLGHWSVWTHSVVKLYEELREYRDGRDIPAELLTRGAAVTDCNGVFFDVAHNFAGCIPGVHEVLRRQGLMAGTWCLDPDETLSEGQAREIDRVYEMYPHLNDDAFVAQNLETWKA